MPMFDWLRRWSGQGELGRLHAELESLRKAVSVSQIMAGGPVSSLSETPALAIAREEERHLFGWVFPVIRTIAQRIAAQPIRVARRVNNPRPKRAVNRKSAPLWVKELPSGLELLKSHQIIDTLACPNPWMVSWNLFWNTIASLECTGKAFWWFPTEEPGTVYPLPSSWCEPMHQKGLFAEYRLWPRNTPNASPVVVPGAEIVRFFYPDLQSPIRGALAPLQTQSRAVVADEAIQEAQRKAFDNGIFPGMAIIVGKNAETAGIKDQRPVLTKAQREQILVAVKQRWQGVTKAGEPLILDGLIEDVKKLTNTIAEMDFLRSGESTKARIFQAFGVNPILCGEIENANRAQAAVADELFCSNTINPKIEMLSQWLTKELPPRYDDPDLIVFMEEARPRDPEQTRAEYDQLAKYGSITKDELRGAYSLPPLKTGGDELIPIATRQPPNPEAHADSEGGAGKAGGTFRRKRLDDAKALWLRTHGAGETAFAKALTQFFATLAREVALGVAHAPTASPDALLLSSEWLPRLQAVARPQIAALALKGATDELKLARKAYAPSRKIADARQVKPSPEVKAAIDHFVDQTLEKPWWEDTLETSRKKLGKALKEGLDAGERLELMADRVKDALGEDSQVRAERIARSESTASLNAGHQASREMLADMGLVSGKEWLAIEDQDTRDAHLEADGQQVGVREKFVVGGEECKHPGDDSLSPEMRINCRCTSVAVFPDSPPEEAARQILDSKGFQAWMKGRGDKIKWVPPNFASKKNDKEIARAADGLEEYGVEVSADALKKVLKAGAMADLDGPTWKAIVNTDSLDVERLADILSVVHRKKKKLRGVLEEFILDRVRAPIIVEVPGGKYFLINGDTRLCVAKVFKVKVRVWCGSVKD
jgi:phage portal protein BeeE